jgi:hypothetical protein
MSKAPSKPEKVYKDPYDIEALEADGKLGSETLGEKKGGFTQRLLEARQQAAKLGDEGMSH